MRIAVISDYVSFINNAFYDRWIFFNVYAKQKEGRMNLFVLQDIENLICRLPVRTIVKCEGNLAFKIRSLVTFFYSGRISEQIPYDQTQRETNAGNLHLVTFNLLTTPRSPATRAPNHMGRAVLSNSPQLLAVSPADRIVGHH